MDEEQLPPHLRAPFPTVSGQAVAVSDHPLASRVACKVLQQGGNAVDAAIAMSFMLGVVCPYYTGIAGGGFALIWMPGWSEPRCLDFREVAPAAAHSQVYCDLPARVSFEGPLAVGVPGSIAGLAELHRSFGRLSWSDLVWPSVERAQKGVSVDPNWARISWLKSQAMARWPELSRIFLPDGRSPHQGVRIFQPDLAQTYRLLAQEGPEAFYEGQLAEAICQATNQWITPQDLRAYRPIWREPLSLPWDGGQLFTLPAPSAGGLQLLQTLGLMERLGRCSTREVEFFHRLAECMRVSFRQRCDSVGDPDFGAPESGHSLDSSWFQHWTAQLSGGERLNLAGPALAYSDGGTASHVVASQEGGLVVITESVNHWFGSMLVPPSTGLVLNNIMDDFSTAPHRPDQFGLVPTPLNQVAPGKRPVSSSTPSIWMEQGRPRLALGSAGGPRITTSVAQILLHCRWSEQNIQQAVQEARIHHQWHPDYLEVEPQFSPWLRQQLAERGHVLSERTCRSHAAAVECHWDQGFFSAGQDFRSFSAARGL